MIIKENEYQGLQDFDVLIEDNNRDSDYFNVTEFPETIPGGKSFFKIAGVEGLLRPESEIKVEILDLNGEVIYTEYPDFVDESDRRTSSISLNKFARCTFTEVLPPPCMTRSGSIPISRLV